MSVSSENQALNALVFLYRQVLEIELEGIEAKRARERHALPTVLTSEETRRLLAVLWGEEALICRLLYGCGLRVMEALRLRVKDVDLDGGKVAVRDRSTPNSRGRCGARSEARSMTCDRKPLTQQHPEDPSPDYRLPRREHLAFHTR